MVLIVIFAALFLLDVLALRYAADSRDGKDWQPADRQWE